MIIHSIAPWFLARYQPNLERTARNSLARAGFECWYPTYLDVRPTPLRKIAPSKRRLAHLFVQELRRPRFVKLQHEVKIVGRWRRRTNVLAQISKTGARVRATKGHQPEGELGRSEEQAPSPITAE